MPIYEYQCQSCGNHSEVIQRLSDSPLETCEECGGDLKKLISAPSFQFKGTGWYVTDYPNSKDGKKKGDADGSSSGEGKASDDKASSSSGSESKDSTSSDSKSKSTSSKSEKTASSSS